MRGSAVVKSEQYVLINPEDVATKKEDALTIEEDTAEDDFEVIDGVDVFEIEDESEPSLEFASPAEHRMMLDILKLDCYEKIRQFIVTLNFFDYLRFYCLREDNVDHSIMHAAARHRDYELIQFFVRESEQDEFEKGLFFCTSKKENMLHILFNPLHEKKDTPGAELACFNIILSRVGHVIVGRALTMRSHTGETPLSLAMKMKDDKPLLRILETSPKASCPIKDALLTSNYAQENFLHTMVKHQYPQWKITLLMTYIPAEKLGPLFLQQGPGGFTPLEHSFASDDSLEQALSKAPTLLQNLDAVRKKKFDADKKYTSCNYSSIYLLKYASAETIQRIFTHWLTSDDYLLGAIKIYFLKLLNPFLYQQMLNRIKYMPSMEKMVTQIEKNEFLIDFAEIFLYNFYLWPHFYAAKDDTFPGIKSTFPQCFIMALLLGQTIDKHAAISWTILQYVFPQEEGPSPLAAMEGMQKITLKLGNSSEIRWSEAFYKSMVRFTPALFKAIRPHFEEKTPDFNASQRQTNKLG